jgi:membrane protein implicated in regulation of membrane protease activity
MDHFTLARLMLVMQSGPRVRPASNRDSGSTIQPDQAEAVGAQRVGVLLKPVAEDRGLREGRVKDRCWRPGTAECR